MGDWAEWVSQRGRGSREEGRKSVGLRKVGHAHNSEVCALFSIKYVPNKLIKSTLYGALMSLVYIAIWGYPWPCNYLTLLLIALCLISRRQNCWEFFFLHLLSQKKSGVCFYISVDYNSPLRKVLEVYCESFTILNNVWTIHCASS